MGYEIDLVHLPGQPAAVVRAHVGHNGIGDFLGQAFGEVMSSVGEQGLHPAGPPFGRYRPTDDGGWDVEAGFPVSAKPTETGRVQPATLPAGSAAHTTHVGDYGDLGAAYQAVADWIVAQGMAASGDPWECYLDEPGVANPRTEVYFPCVPRALAPQD
ncbi:MAG TPA: GyrI-like domain-containing protein [Oryzihumus sp.]|nr:GyrI-like domain-containing protein [Oryzihumus sp.]